MIGTIEGYREIEERYSYSTEREQTHSLATAFEVVGNLAFELRAGRALPSPEFPSARVKAANGPQKRKPYKSRGSATRPEQARRARALSALSG